MPASRILEGRLPEQHPSAHIFLAPNHSPQTSQSGISRAKPVASLQGCASSQPQTTKAALFTFLRKTVRQVPMLSYFSA